MAMQLNILGAFQYTITQEVVTYMHTARISIHDQDRESKKYNFTSQPYTSHAAGWFQDYFAFSGSCLYLYNIFVHPH